jgi:methyl-accepting chemotaxis protein
MALFTLREVLMKFWRSLSIAARLILLSTISTLGFASIIVLGLAQQWDTLRDARQRELKSLVDAAVAIAAGMDDQAKKGAMSVEEAQARAKAQIGMMRYQGNEYFWINDFHPKMVMHPIRTELDGKDLSSNKDPDGKLLFVEFVNTVRKSGGGFVEYKWPRPGSDAPVAKMSYVHGYQPWGWIIGTGVYTDDLTAAFWSQAIEEAISIGVVFLVILALTAVLIRSITAPLKAMQEAMKRLANNEFDQEIPGQDRRDELGVMARFLAIFRNSGGERLKLEEQQRHVHAREQRRRQTVEALVSEFQTEAHSALSNVDQGATQLQSTAHAMTDLAGSTTDRASAVAAASEQASSNVTTVAAASEELAHSIDEISRQLATTSSTIDEAAHIAHSADAKVAALAQSAQQIGAVVTLIREIAAQTNLLALNATIEAARAGEAGRGFAVVASEVKDLAEQTAKATTTISEQITLVQSATDNAVASIKQITTMMAEVNSGATAIAAALEEQQAATQEISSNVHEAAKGTRHVAESIVDVMTATQDTSTGMGEILRVGKHVAEKTSDLKGRIETFLQKVAAA